jgi:hypothetical protein
MENNATEYCTIGPIKTDNETTNKCNLSLLTPYDVEYFTHWEKYYPGLSGSKLYTKMSNACSTYTHQKTRQWNL